MPNELMALDYTQLPVTTLGDANELARMAKTTDFLARLQLFTKGRQIDRNLIRPGNYGIPESDDVVIDLGDSIDVLPLARRPKAIDLSDTEAIVTTYDPQSEEWKRIEAGAGETDSGCMFGPSFLMFERSTGRFLEFFCGNKSARLAAAKIYPFCPISEAEIPADKREVIKPHGPIPMTMSSDRVEKKKWSWHVPVISPCSTPFVNLPPMEEIVKEIKKFLTVKTEGPEKVQGGKKRAR